MQARPGPKHLVATVESSIHTEIEMPDQGAGLLVVVEGNIGAGKSTLLDALASCVRDVFHRECVILKEPVDEWSAPVAPDSDDGILQLYYKDKSRFAFAFQATVFVSRVQQLARALQDHPGAVIVAERSPSSGLIFARQLHDVGQLSGAELALHEQWADANERLHRIAGVVYLRTDPDVCMQRTRARGRAGEAAVEPALLADLHRLHEAYVTRTVATKGIPVLELDGNLSAGRGALARHVDALVRFLREIGA